MKYLLPLTIGLVFIAIGAGCIEYREVFESNDSFNGIMGFIAIILLCVFMHIKIIKDNDK
jgi:hypothetical protein